MATSALEWRQHELRKTRLALIDGHLTTHGTSVRAGGSVRAYHDGYWGFASAPADERVDAAEARAELSRQALAHARAMAAFGPRSALALPGTPHRGEQPRAGRGPLPPAETVERMRALHAHARQAFPGLRAVHVRAVDEDHQKHLLTEAGADSLSRIQRAAVYVTLVAEDDQGGPIELMEIVSGHGSLADLAWTVDDLAPALDRLHGHLQAKRRAVPARGGRHTVVLGADLAGMLAHEAMGHPCEADSVLGGAVTARLQGEVVASELVSMVDFAHSFQGRPVMCPVLADDEGTPAQDVVLIDRGRLTGFMHSRETAARLGQAPTGSARAYAPDDEPLIRMRNTAILPGDQTLAQLIAGVDDGYLLLHTGNGQADATTEFMFGITLGYEIRGGRLGRAIRDTTLSGNALQVLRDVDGVGQEMAWANNGYCGKKQPMVVSLGGPALRTRAHLGGA